MVKPMLLGVLKRLLVVFVLSAFLGAGFVQAMPTLQIAAAAQDEMSATTMADGGPGMPMNSPCKGKVPNCYGSMGCLFMVALPTAVTLSETTLSWSRVTYPMVVGTRPGRSVEPAIGPPIRAA